MKTAGTIELGDKERLWRFLPAKPWKSGKYRLAVDMALEDLAGNRVGRPFEVDVLHPVQKHLEVRIVRLPFEAIR